MSHYEIAVRQVGTGYMYIEAETPEEAEEQATRLLERGIAEVMLSDDGWDDEAVTSVGRQTILDTSERENIAENAKRLAELTDCMYDHDHTKGGCEYHD